MLAPWQTLTWTWQATDNQEGDAPAGEYRVVLSGAGSAAASGSEDGGITPGTQTHTRISYYYFGSQRVGMRQGEVGQGRDSVSWLHADHLGSVSEATTGSGGVSSRQRYFPYGRVRYSSGSPPTTYNYTGQRLDQSTGLLFFQARYYDPRLSRFVSADTMVPEPGNPQSLNRFAYGYNNPVKFTDPSGHYATWEGDPGSDFEVLTRIDRDGRIRFLKIHHEGEWYLNKVETAIAEYIINAVVFDRYDSPLPELGVFAGQVIDNAAEALAYDTEWGTAIGELAPLQQEAAYIGAVGSVGSALPLVGETAQAYIQRLENQVAKSGKPPHAWSKHSPTVSADAELRARSMVSSKPQTGFADEDEMASAVAQSLTANMADIQAKASSGYRGFATYKGGPIASYYGYQGGAPISGTAPTAIVLWFDGKGGWVLHSAYPKP